MKILLQKSKNFETILSSKKGTAELLIARELAQNNGEFKEKSFMLEIKNARDMKVGFLRTVLNGIQIESTRNEANSTVDSTGTDF